MYANIGPDLRNPATQERVGVGATTRSATEVLVARPYDLQHRVADLAVKALGGWCQVAGQPVMAPYNKVMSEGTRGRSRRSPALACHRCTPCPRFPARRRSHKPDCPGDNYEPAIALGPANGCADHKDHFGFTEPPVGGSRETERASRISCHVVPGRAQIDGLLVRWAVVAPS
jgi:hypothetical protein